MDIDYIFPYVDSNDPEWQKTYKIFCENRGITQSTFGNEKSRFRDWGNLLKFVFRGLAKNMPWLHKIYFIVQSKSQVPDWLDTSKVEVVLHSDFIPARYLPTYNSTTIEMFLWNIPSLSEHFIYANDDLFPSAPSKPSDFFDENGLPIIHLCLRNSNFMTPFRKTVVRGQDMILNDFPDVRVPAGKYYKTEHLSSPMLKSTCKKVYTKHKVEITKGISALRTIRNVNQYIYLFYQVFSGEYTNRPFPGRYTDFVSNTIDDIIKTITSKKYKMICVNDSGLDNISKGLPVFNAFLKILPDICRFEKGSVEEVVTPEEKIEKDKAPEVVQVEVPITNKEFIKKTCDLYEYKNKESTWRIAYVCGHPFPWILDIPVFNILSIFEKIDLLKAAISSELDFYNKVAASLNNFSNNLAIDNAPLIELSFGEYIIRKEKNVISVIDKKHNKTILKDNIPKGIEILKNIQFNVANISNTF